MARNNDAPVGVGGNLRGLGENQLFDRAELAVGKAVDLFGKRDPFFFGVNGKAFVEDFASDKKALAENL